MPTDFAARVAGNADLGHGNWLVEFEAPEEVLRMSPAQFFMIGIPGTDVLLRRPFSVCGLPGTFEDAPDDRVQVLYRVHGRGTALLSSLAPGAPIRVLGPLGRGFSPPEDPTAIPLIVAGGIGSAPFPALIASLRAGGRPRPRMIYGARSARDLPLLDWFRARTEDLRVTTDDGSSGRRGVVTDALGDLLSEEAGPHHVYACGPRPMLEAVGRLALDRDIRCDLSLEAPMACGFGVCLGCVVAVRGEVEGEIRYERVCVEGPVMPAGRLAW